MGKTDVKECTANVFFKEFYSCRYYIQVFNPFWVNFCVWYDSGLVSYFFMWLSSFPNTIYWRYYPFSIVCSLLFCHKLLAHICMGVFLDSQFCSIDLCICFSAITMLFWLLQLCCLKSGSVILPALLFFLRITLAIWGLLWFHGAFCGSI